MQHKNPFYLIKNINDKFEARGNTECQKAGLTLAQFKILIYIKEHPDKLITQKELEKVFKVSHATINGILTRLEEKGFVSTSLVRDGIQQKQVFMTEKGNDAYEKMEIPRTADDIALEKLFTKKELNQFRDYLLRVFEYVSKD